MVSYNWNNVLSLWQQYYNLDQKDRTYQMEKGGIISINVF